MSGWTKRRLRALCGGVFVVALTSLPLLAQPGLALYEQAASYIQRGQAASAVPLLERKLQEDPQDLRALTLMGMALAAESRRAEASAYFERALESNPAYAPALRNLAINDMELGRIASAKAHFERLLQLTPLDAIAHLALAQLEFAAKNYRSAAENYRNSGDLYLRDPRNVLDFARAWVELGQPAKAAEILERMPEPADAATHFAAGAVLASLQNYAVAAREFERALPGASNPYETGYNLMLARFRAGDAAAAARTGEELIARGSRNPEVYNLLAQAYEKSGRTKEAYDALRTASNIDPTDSANYLDLIALCVTHKNYDLALEIADIGLARLPNSDRLHVQRGIVLALMDRFDGARAEFEAGVKLAPDKGLPHVALALMLLQSNQVAEAVEVLRRRVRTASDDAIALWFFGEALSRTGLEPGSRQENEAVDALSRSVRLKPDIPQARVVLGKLLARRGELDLAAQHLARALELDPDNVPATYQLAQIFQKKGNAARAQQLFAKVSRAKAEEREQFTRGGLLHIIREGSR